MNRLQKKPGEISFRLTKGWELVVYKYSIGLFCVYIGSSCEEDRGPYIGFHFGQQKYNGKRQWGI